LSTFLGLWALGNYTLTFYDMFFYWVREPDVSSIALEVFSEEGVKVRLGGVEVREVAFKDVSPLKVTFTTTLTMSTEPLCRGCRKRSRGRG
jgi:hypothetical protein